MTNGKQMTNKSLLEDITGKLNVLPDMSDKIHEIDKKMAVVCNQVETNKEEIDTLRKRGWIADGFLGAFTVFMAYVSSTLGGRQ